MSRLYRWLNFWWPILVLVVVAGIIFATNYLPGTFLVGWDVTMPEMAPQLNLQRFIFGVWQEYRGLGTLDGMAHTANMFYALMTWIESLVLPLAMIRYLNQIVLYVLGGIGVYLLWVTELSFLLKKPQHNSAETVLTPSLSQTGAGLVAALLYLGNLMTIQMFFIPLETFSFHFVALPWGVWALLRFLHKPSWRRAMVLFLTNLMTTPQAHVPTLFLVYAGVIAGIMLSSWLARETSLKTSLVAIIILVGVHLFWGGPYVYSALHKSAEIGNSKINQLSTNQIFYRNKAYGNLVSIMSFGGFNFDYKDWRSQDKKYGSMMSDWLSWYDASNYKILAGFWTIFGWFGWLVLLVFGVLRKRGLLVSLSLIGIVVLAMLATDTPGLEIVSIGLRQYVPFFGDIFRFTFTKFSLVYVFILALGAAVLSQVIFNLILKFSRSKLIMTIGIMLAGGSILAMVWPVFTGKFWYRELRLKIPESYFTTQTWLKNNLSQDRLAVVPLPNLFGWTNQTWGHRGSGFFWQMIQQPTLDRSFDAWSKFNETAYLQLNQAVYGGDVAAVLQILRKFHISGVLADQTIFQPGSFSENLALKKLTDFLTSTEVTPGKITGDLGIYKIETQGRNLIPLMPQSLVVVDLSYPNVGTTKDVAYNQLGDYLSKTGGTNYPFSWLQQEKIPNFVAESELKNLRFSWNQESSKQKLILAKLAELEQSIGLRWQLTATKSGEARVLASLNLPKILLNDQIVKSASAAANFEVKSRDNVLLSVNGGYLPLSVSEPEVLMTLPMTGKLSVKVWNSLNLEKFDLNRSASNSAELLNYCQIVNSRVMDCAVKEINVSKVEKKTNLVRIIGEFVNLTGKVPDVCVFSPNNPTGCLNNLSYFAPLPGQKFSKFTTYVPVPEKKSNLLARFIWPKDMGDQPWQKLQSDVFSQQGDLEIDLTAQIKAFDDYLPVLASKSGKIGFEFNQAFQLDLLHSDKPRSFGLANCSQPQQGNIFSQPTSSGNLLGAEGKAIGCETTYVPEIDPNQEYLYFQESQVSGGAGGQTILLNPSTKHFDLQIPISLGIQSNWWSIYPSKLAVSEIKTKTSNEPFQFVWDFETYGREKAQILMKSAKLQPLPLNWLASLHLETTNSTEKFQSKILNWQKFGTSFYKIEVLIESKEAVLVLPQSFDKAWLAVFSNDSSKWNQVAQFSYNGWANAWYLPQGHHQVWLIYWPELIVWVGLLVLFITLITLLLGNLKRR